MIHVLVGEFHVATGETVALVAIGALEDERQFHPPVTVFRHGLSGGDVEQTRAYAVFDVQQALPGAGAEAAPFHGVLVAAHNLAQWFGEDAPRRLHPLFANGRSGDAGQCPFEAVLGEVGLFHVGEHHAAKLFEAG